MQAFNRFIMTLWKSASEPDYYIWLLGQKISNSVKFYLGILLVVAIFDVAILRIRETPAFIATMDQQSSSGVSSLPDSFTAVYSSGTLDFKGVKLPFVVESNKALKTLGVSEKLLTLTPEESPAEKTFLTLTPTQLILQGNEELPLSTTAYSLSDVFGTQTMSLDKEALEEKRSQAIESMPQAANILALIAVPIWFLGLIVATTLTLLLLTLLSNSFSWIMGIHMPFVKSFQLGLHAIAVATVVDLIKYLMLPGSGISLVIPGYLGIMILATWRLRGRVVAKI